ncbi:MAG: alginate export family protein [Planctomycetota bacterium]
MRQTSLMLVAAVMVVATPWGWGGDAVAQPAVRPRAPGTPQPPPPEAGLLRPPPAVLTQDLDYSVLAAPELRTDRFDALRYIPVGDAEDGAFVSLGVKARFEYQFFEDQIFGSVPGSTEFFNTRVNPWASLTLGPRLRAFVAFKHGDILNGEVVEPPTEDDSFDLHQGFVEWSFGDALGRDVSDVLVRVGRQELHYGAGRFVSIREGPNVRDDFDGVTLRVRARDRSVTDGLAFFLVDDRPGGFDNGTNTEEGLWGVYHSRPAGELAGRPLFLDVYYIGFQFDDLPFVTAVGTELRHSVMVRPWVGGPPGAPGWGGDLETGFQFGDLDTAAGDLDIFAFQLVGHVQYTFADRPLKPTARMRFGYTSGDADGGDGTLGTYRAAFPPGRFFGDTTVIGPGNIFGFQPEFDLRLGPKTTLTSSTRFYWRSDTDDGLYSRGNTILRGAAGDERYIGWETNLLLDHDLDANWRVGLAVGYFEPGDFFDDNPPGDAIIFAAAKVIFGF